MTSRRDQIELYSITLLNLSSVLNINTLTDVIGTEWPDKLTVPV